MKSHATLVAVVGYLAIVPAGVGGAMSIVLLCPTCNTRLTIGDDRAGTTFDCPKCDTEVSVPFVLPPPKPEPDAAIPPAHPAPTVIDWADVESDPDDDPPIPRRRRRRRKPQPWYWRLWVGLAVVAGVLVWGCAITAFVQQNKKSTLPDLNEYFNQRLTDNKVRSIDDPELAGKTFKGHGVVAEDRIGVDHIELLVYLTDSGGATMRWERDKGAAPQIGNRINFTCKVTRKGTANEFEMVSWSQR